MTPPAQVPAVTGEWECTECGNVEAGLAARRPPRCPECGAPADALEFHGDEDDDWDELDEDEAEEDDEGLLDDYDEDEDESDERDGDEAFDDDEPY